ncbi:MAG: DUF6717 family protein [Cyanobacteria bacterium P01_F01_bin.33]
MLLVCAFSLEWLTSNSGSWMFDDETHQIYREPFVRGSSEILDDIASQTERDRDMTLIFSDEPVDEWDYSLELIRKEDGGALYYSEEFDRVGWLCPALYVYFSSTPAKLYLKAV